MVESISKWLSSKLTATMDLSSFNLDYESNDLKNALSKNIIRDVYKTDLTKWPETFFNDYFDLTKLPTETKTKFKQAIVNYAYNRRWTDNVEVAEYQNQEWTIKAIRLCS